MSETGKKNSSSTLKKRFTKVNFRFFIDEISLLTQKFGKKLIHVEKHVKQAKFVVYQPYLHCSRQG